MNIRQKTWLLRVVVIAIAILIPMLQGRSLAAAVGFAVFAAILTAVLSPVVGLPPILVLYGMKFFSREEKAIDLSNPEEQLFLGLAIPLYWAAVGLLAHYL